MSLHLEVVLHLRDGEKNIYKLTTHFSVKRPFWEDDVRERLEEKINEVIEKVHEQETN